MALAQSDEDLQAVARLRADRFRDNIAASDLDRFDPLCTHLLIRSGADQRPVGAARFRLLIGTQDVSSSYCAQIYDLSRLGEAGLRLLEIGRICITADQINQADVARALLAGLTRAALIHSVDMLVGCASFPGARPEDHGNALRYLQAHHIGPEALRPDRGQGIAYDLRQAAGGPEPEDLRHVPELLRMYLAMGGWVTDHAVCDNDLDTLHVFAAVDVRAIPPARMRVLKMLAGR